MKKELYVQKKDASIEKFDGEKLSISIANASDEIEEPLTDSDIHNILREVMHKLENYKSDPIPSFVIREEMLNALLKLGFHDVYRKYRDYES